MPCTSSSTDLSPNPAQKILQHYDLPGLLQATLTPLVTSRNEVTRIETGQDTYILRSSTLADGTLRLNRHTQLADGLQSMGVAAETVYKNCHGHLITHGIQGPYALFGFIKGQTTQLDQKGYVQLGFALAKLHQNTRHNTFEQKLLAKFDPLNWVQDAAICIEAHSLSPKSRTRLQQCLAFIAHQLNAIDWQNIPFQMGHGDAHPMNLIGTTWIDFEDAYWGPVSYDLATVVWSTLRCEQTQPLWRAALEAYNTILPIDPTTLSQISILVAVRHLWWLGMHAMHFGHFPIHSQEPNFLDQGIELLEIICTDACGMPA